MNWPAAVADLGGAHPARAPPRGPKFSQFHAVFRKIWQNHMLAPLPPEGWRPLLWESWIRPWAGISVSSLSGYATLKCGHLLISDCVQCFNGVLLHNNESTPWTAGHVAVSPWNNVLSDLRFFHCITPGGTCVISDASVVHAPSVVKRELAKIAFFPAISSTPCLTGC